MKKLIYSCIMLALSAFMCITVTIAWFTKNLEVTADNLVINGINKDCSVDLYMWDGDSYEKQTTVLNLSDIFPGDIKYFKLVVTSKSNENLSFQASYSGYSSELSSDVLVDDDLLPTKVYYEDIAGNEQVLGELTENQCLVDSQVLYQYNPTSEEIELSHYLIHNTMRSYTFAEASDSAVSSVSGLTGKGIGDPITSNVVVAPSATATVYFALEFNESASLVLGNSNCYQKQALIIDHIIVQLD